MATPMEHATALAEQVVDAARAAFAAAWPRSIEAREIERLAHAGCPAGAICDVEFSLSFDGPAMTAAGLDAVRAAGFVVTDESSLTRGFVVVRLPLRLQPWDLARTSGRLNRLIAPFGGFAVFIGPVDVGVPAADDAPPIEPKPSLRRDLYRAVS